MICKDKFDYYNCDISKKQQKKTFKRNIKRKLGLYCNMCGVQLKPGKLLANEYVCHYCSNNTKKFIRLDFYSLEDEWYPEQFWMEIPDLIEI